MVASICTLKSASNAGQYYQSENYYAEHQSGEAVSDSQWWGQGATALNLNGQVSANDLTPILEGELPHGQKLGRWVHEEWKHKPGFDLTFSMSKSASIAWLIGGDERIKDAHDRAVSRTLTHIEDKFNLIRKRCGEGHEFENNGKLVVAKFLHRLSRENDPQGHTHCVIANAILAPDNKWRSLWNEDLYTHSMLSGTIYDACFAQELKNIGYDLYQKENGFYEIKGIEQKTIELFSKRRSQIEKNLQERGESGGHAASKANFRTRKSKSTSKDIELKQQWQQDCHKHGQSISSIENIIEISKLGSPTLFSNEEKMIQDCVHRAIDSLSEKEAVFNLNELYRESIRLSSPGLDPEKIIQQADKELNSKSIISIAINKGEHWLTTNYAIALEKDLVAMAHHGKDMCLAAMKKEHVDAKLSESRLSYGQKQAVSLITSSRDRFISIQGRAGSGKTTMLKEANKMLEEKGYRIIGLTDSGKAREELSKKAGISECYTLSYFLTYIEENENKIMPKSPFSVLTGKDSEKTYFFIDESSLVSNKDAHQLMRFIDKRQARGCFIGDKYQHSAVNAGKPIEMLLSKGLTNSSMTEIRRQEDKNLKRSVEYLYSHNVEQSFKLLDKRIIEINSENCGKSDIKTARLNQLVERYINSEHLDNRHIVVQGNDDRKKVNSLVRDALKQNGQLSDNGINATILENKRITEAERKWIHTYSNEDIIRFNRDFPSLGIAKNTYYSVMNVDLERKSLSLGLQGKSITVSPLETITKAKGAFEIYKPQQREITAGEQIKWTRTVKMDGLSLNTGSKAKVCSIKNNITTLKLPNGQSIDMNLKENSMQHWDYAYSDTSHSAQGGDWKDVFCLVESNRTKLTHLRSFLVSISRAKSDLTIICDDKENLLKQVKMLTSKTSALESLESSQLKIEPTQAPIQSSFLQQDSSINSLQSTERNAQPFLDASLIKHSLHNDLISVVSDITGRRPSSINKSEARWGNKGSLKFDLSPQSLGQWKDFESGAGGKDIISFYMQHQGFSQTKTGFYEALRSLSDRYSLNFLAEKSLVIDKAFKVNYNATVPLKETSSIQKMLPTSKATNQDNRQEYAKNIYLNKTVSLTHKDAKIARQYFKSRGIAESLPKNIRFARALKHPHTKKHAPAIVAPVQNSNGDITGIVRIFLNPDGKKYQAQYNSDNQKTLKAASKANLGNTSHGGVILSDGSSSKAFLAEGIETALSLNRHTHSDTVIATLSSSNFKNAPLPPHIKSVYICADNDGDQLSPLTGISKAIDYFIQQGKDVYICAPHMLPSHQKTDFNDLLTKKSKFEVQNTIAHASKVSLSNAFDSKQPLSKNIQSLQNQTKIDYTNNKSRDGCDNGNLMPHNALPSIQLEKSIAQMER